MATIGSLAINLTARTGGLDKGLKKARNRVSTFSRSMSGAAGMLGSIGAPLALGAGLAAIVREGAGFEKQMSAIQAVNGATEAQMAQLTEKAETLGRTTAFSGAEAAQGMEALARAGFTVNETMAATDAALSLAAADGLELGEAANITAATIRQFGLDAGHAGAVADVLAKGAASGLTDVSQLGNAMGFAASSAKLAGKGLFETTSALSVLSTQIGGDKAGRGLRSIFAGMAKPTADAQKQLDALGISFMDQAGNIKPLADVVDEFSGKLDGMAAGDKSRILQTIFDKQTASAFGGLMAAGGDELRKVQAGLEGGGGFASEAAEKRLDNVAGAFTKVKSALGGMAIDIFQQFSGPLQSGLEGFASFVGGPLTTTIAGGIQGIISVFSAIGSAVAPVWNFISDGVHGLVTVATFGFERFGDLWSNVIDRMMLKWLNISGNVSAFLDNPAKFITSGGSRTQTAEESRLKDKIRKDGARLAEDFMGTFAARQAIADAEGTTVADEAGFNQATLDALNAAATGGPDGEDTADANDAAAEAGKAAIEPLKAAMLGSRESFDIINRAMKGGEKATEKNTKDAVIELKKMNDTLAEQTAEEDTQIVTIGA